MSNVRRGTLIYSAPGTATNTSLWYWKRANRTEGMTKLVPFDAKRRKIYGIMRDSTLYGVPKRRSLILTNSCAEWQTASAQTSSLKVHEENIIFQLWQVVHLRAGKLTHVDMYQIPLTVTAVLLACKIHGKNCLPSRQLISGKWHSMRHFLQTFMSNTNITRVAGLRTKSFAVACLTGVSFLSFTNKALDLVCARYFSVF